MASTAAQELWRFGSRPIAFVSDAINLAAHASVSGHADIRFVVSDILRLMGYWLRDTLYVHIPRMWPSID